MPSTCSGQVGGDRRLQGEAADQQGSEKGGEAAMEQLAGEIGPQGQAAVSQKGQHLAVDREAGPPQHEGGHGQPAGHCARSGEGGHPGGELQQRR